MARHATRTTKETKVESERKGPSVEIVGDPKAFVQAFAGARAINEEAAQVLKKRLAELPNVAASTDAMRRSINETMLKNSIPESLKARDRVGAAISAAMNTESARQRAQIMAIPRTASGKDIAALKDALLAATERAHDAEVKERVRASRREKLMVGLTIISTAAAVVALSPWSWW